MSAGVGFPPGKIEVANFYFDDTRADLEVEIPGDGALILRAYVAPEFTLLNASTGSPTGPRPVGLVVTEPEVLRAAARVLNLAAHEMETLRATLADVRNRERRYQPGRVRSVIPEVRT